MNDPLPDDVRATLAQYHFDRIPFDTLRERLSRTASAESLHMIGDRVEPPDASAVDALPARDSDAWRTLETDGRAAIDRGELGVLILAGGMATRFGSAVKALSPVFEGRDVRFLDAKLADIRHVSPKGKIDTNVLTSFTTHDAIATAFADAPVHLTPQFVSLRLTAAGTLFRTPNQRVSLYAPGHGDVPDALTVSGALARMKAAGVRTVLLSNVDNLAATVEPALFAKHRALGAKITVELVSKRPGDKGGLPVRRDGKLVLAEAFRLPPEFPHDEFPMFNTNTLWIDIDALEGDCPWTWCVARKKVDGREAIQFERLVGELTWWRPTKYVHVSRDGAESRFIPVKDPDDLRAAQTQLDEVLSTRAGLRRG